MVMIGVRKMMVMRKKGARNEVECKFTWAAAATATSRMNL
jgi:hypothetical protein